MYYGDKMNFKKRKMIAPVVVCVIVLIYYALYFGILFSILKNTVWIYLLGIIPILLSGVMIKVCIERINEIKKGEEDDLSKY